MVRYGAYPTASQYDHVPSHVRVLNDGRRKNRYLAEHAPAEWQRKDGYERAFPPLGRERGAPTGGTPRSESSTPRLPPIARAQHKPSAGAVPRGSRHGLGLRTRVLSPWLFANSFFYQERMRHDAALGFHPVLVHANYESGRAAKWEALADAIAHSRPLRPPPLASVERMDARWEDWWRA